MNNFMKKLILLAILFSNYTLAEEAKVPAKAKATVKTPAKAATTYKKNMAMEFDGRNVDGDVVSPDSADVEGDKNIRFDPLLEGRKDFKREFKRSSGVTR